MWHFSLTLQKVEWRSQPFLKTCLCKWDPRSICIRISWLFKNNSDFTVSPHVGPGNLLFIKHPRWFCCRWPHYLFKKYCPGIQQSPPIKVPLRGTEFSSSPWWKEVIQHLYCWIILLCGTTCRKELREVSSIILTSVNFVVIFLILAFLWLFSIVRGTLMLQMWALSHSHLFLCSSLKHRELSTIASIFREWLNYPMSIPLLVTNRD